ncbi:hypothetical protein DYB32_007651 [Aphanomyces invadans]|uniref:Uncharacterized protein n=1 Tax=Aphanomyces invadans TaxID=157072 RepID=A0A3R6VUP2_9STRA|nr:hypothetical protein DYB32_007651 [Aphanomyces invadans]
MLGLVEFSVTSTIDLLLYVALAIVITLIVVVIYFAHQYLYYKNHGSPGACAWVDIGLTLLAVAHADYEELRDLDGNIVQQANTICSNGPGIRMDEAPTRPKLQLLRAASSPTNEDVPTGRAGAMLQRSESNPGPHSSPHLVALTSDEPSPCHPHSSRTSSNRTKDSEGALAPGKASSAHTIV